jgi:hypothetical protein
MNIECKINDIIIDLDRISITHPNIAEFWKKYILKKEEMLHNSLNECKSIIDKLQNLNEDVDPESLAIAYIVAKSLRSSYSSDI